MVAGTEKQRPPRLLMISPHFPPSGNPQGIQSLKLARALTRAGISVEVVAAGEGRVEPGNSHAKGDCLRPEKGLAVSCFQSAGPLVRRYRVAQRAYRMWHPLDPYFHQRGLVSTLKRLLGSTRFDVIISRSEPLVSHDALLSLRHLARGAQMVHWFSDPVPTNRTPEMMKLGWRRRRCEELIAECLRPGHLVIGVTEEILEPFRAVASPGAELCVLPHAFDAEDWPWPPRPRMAGRQELTILHTGSFYWTRHPFTLLDGVARFALETRRPIRVQLLGSMTEEVRRALDQKSYPFPLERAAPTDHLGSRQAIEHADILCVIDCELPRNVHLPSKVADYVGACKPILYVGREDSPTCRLLAGRHPAFRQASTPDQVRAAIDWLVEQGRPIPAEAYRSSYLQCSPEVVYGNLVERFLHRSHGAESAEHPLLRAPVPDKCKTDFPKAAAEAERASL